ncbi:MAG TPA: ATP-binding protein [Spirochaetia bacterium]|nr:ATP-binding protein [Spirochaetia bacterium]
MRSRFLKFAGVNGTEASPFPRELSYRFQFARLMLLAVAPLFYAYAVHFYVIRLYLDSGFMLAGGLITSVSTFLGVRIGQQRRAVRFYYGVALSIILILLLHDADVVWRNGRLEYLVWLFLYPPLTFFLLGEKIGVYAVLVVSVVMAFVLLFPIPGVSVQVNLTNLKIQFGVAFLSAIAGAYLYERTRRIALEELGTRQERLLRSERRLRETVDELRASNQKSEQLAVEARQASQAKSDFLAAMSHELRTPLHHIIGFTELVLEGVDGPLTDGQRECLGDVVFSSRHLLSLIEDILDLSKVEAGKPQIHPSPVDLRALVERSVVMVRDRAQRHRITIGIELPAVPAVLVADQRMMRQIAYNLLSNAVKFTPDDGRVSLTLAVEANGGELEAAELRVTDTGVGIRPEDLERIFEPFVQVGATPGGGAEGTGLGLPLTRKLVELHGGRVWAESEGLGKGSTFRVRLPAGRPSAGCQT